jgi:hypothetical protein
MINSFFSTDFLQPLLGRLAILSLLTFVLSLILIPWVVGRLQRDCFLTLHCNNPVPPPLSIGSIIMAICRNVLGLFLLLAGIIMLFLPGQGLLTILLGTLLISFPGKKKLIGTLIHQPKIQRSMDWLREKRGKSPFLWPKAQSTCKDT